MTNKSNMSKMENLQENSPEYSGSEIAIIGLAGRFPGAKNVEQFWHNLKNGVESISFFTPEELDRAGVPAELQANPDFVPASGILDEVECFDATLFGYSPREAEVIDPQQRLFLECAWQALEDAGYNPDIYPGLIGVYAGLTTGSYLSANLQTNPEYLANVDGYQIMLGNHNDFLTTRVSYKLNLRGPSFNIQTACSTSLVAVHVACQNLLNGECDMALAGGVSVQLPQKAGYLYQPGGISSPDGHCRAFDQAAGGTVSGNGLGLVLLKRLQDALNDGDNIYAVIKGTAINNDGAVKAGYTAPSVAGQAGAIAEALAVAGVEPESINYIETHGTGTTLGDPIEIAALTKVWKGSAAPRQSCALGSVKTNIGHLDAAAGITGLIKTVLSLHHKLIPPSLHFSNPNPKLALENSPFYVNATAAEWAESETPRRAGVSSFGVGGTNAHVILEEAPPKVTSEPARACQLLPLSAKTPAALKTLAGNLAEYLRQNPDTNLDDFAYTLQVGRKVLNYRAGVVSRGQAGAIAALENLKNQAQSPTYVSASASTPPVILMFPGQGEQYPQMGRELYQTEPEFQVQFDRCAELLLPHLGQDIRQVLFEDSQADQINQTFLTQPILFAFEYALAKLWQAWGIQPQALIGHSLGEYVAACLAGVFSLEDALRLVTARGRLMQQMEAGAMLAVPLGEAELAPWLNNELSLAAVNAPTRCVVAGKPEAITALETALAEQGISGRRLRTSHAFHSVLMEPVLAGFRAQLGQLSLKTPKIPFVSNYTGDWITPEQATSPDYWVNHLRQAVRFSQGITRLLETPGSVLLEVGPGHTLGKLAVLHRQPEATNRIISSCLSANGATQVGASEIAQLYQAAGQLWEAGGHLDWFKFNQPENRQRMALPTYPFSRQRHWVEAQLVPGTKPATGSAKKSDLTDWFYAPSWKRLPFAESSLTDLETGYDWVVFAPETDSLTDALINRLKQLHQRVVIVKAGRRFACIDEADSLYSVSPNQTEDYEALLEELQRRQHSTTRLIHAWQLTSGDPYRATDFEKSQEQGFYSLVALAQAVGNLNLSEKIQLWVLSSNLQKVTGVEQLEPQKATLLGPCRVIPQEYANIQCTSLDVSSLEETDQTVEKLLLEFLTEESTSVVAHRNGYRWLQAFEPIRLGATKTGAAKICKGGVYLITGGLGGIGLAFAEYLALNYQARLVLIGRSEFPAKEQWATWLSQHGETDPISQKIRKLQSFEDAGAEVLAMQADVADPVAVGRVAYEVSIHFGNLDGILHSAGVPANGIIQLKTAEKARQVMDAKIEGALNLLQAFEVDKLDFLIFFSSLAALHGGFGQVDYCAANSFLDALATAQNRRQVFSINWDIWQEVGMGANIGGSKQVQRWQAESLQDGLKNSESMEIFRRVLGRGFSQIAVSTYDLTERIRLMAEFQQEIEAPTTNVAGSDDEADQTYAESGLADNYIAPRNKIEEIIVGIWQGLLGVKKVGVCDDLFRLGADSLLTTQLISRLNKAFEIKIPLRSLFEATTIAEQAQLVQTYCRPEQTSAPAISLEPTSTLVPRPADLTALPLSFAQQRLWFLDQLKPGSAFNNIQIVLEMKGELNQAALEASLRQIVQRHEVLRTNFENAGEQPLQRIKPLEACNVGLPLTDLSELAEVSRLPQAYQLIEQEAAQPFDLAHDQLFRARVLRLQENEHWLSLTFHHISFDGWSMGVLTSELSELYQAYCQGQPAQLPALSIQYADYAIWQREWLQGTVLNDHLNYWREHLADAPQVLELPTDYPRPALQSFRGAQVRTELERPIVQGLKELSQQQGASLFMTLLASFKLLLSRYSGQEDLVVGTPIANRQQRETESLIGFFVNTLALRTKLTGNPSFVELLQRVKESSLGGYTHQELPFERLVGELQPGRELSHTPIFQVMFALQNAPGDEFNLGELKVGTIEGVVNSTRYDLTLNVLEGTDGRLNCFMEYSTDLFEETTATRMLGQWVTLLQNILAKPSQTIQQLDVLSAAERQLLSEFSRPLLKTQPNADTANQTIHKLFEEQAEKTPAAIALEFEGEQLSYAELNRRANRLAHFLQAQGVERDQLVGVCLERNTELVVALLAILKAGGAYVPLDPAYPQERLDFMLADCQARLVISQAATLERVGWAEQAHEANRQYVLLEGAWWANLCQPAGETETQENDSNPPSETDAGSLAYMIYTSGSTGKPKGVLVEHRGMVNLLRSNRARFGFGQTEQPETFPCLASFAFDIFGFELYNPLVNGGKALLVGRDHLLDMPRLLTSLQNVELLHTVPSLMRQLLTDWQSMTAAEQSSYPFEKLRCIFIGGDAVNTELLEEMRRVFRYSQIHVLYGPTEATIICTSYAVPSLQEQPALSPAKIIGSGLAGAQLLVLDRWQNLAPLGVNGELYIGGSGVARCYHQRPELTGEKFVELNGERYYRSGDQVRWLTDGQLEFVGRVDNQVKIRGYRIEPGEVETVLAKQAGIAECVVIVREDQPGEKRLVAYLTGKSAEAGQLISRSELRQKLGAVLPDYMIPGSFVVLEQLPLNANGKLDRKALPLPERESSLTDQNYRPAVSTTEIALAKIWGELLNISQVGLDDNFFELGGHSLLVTQLASRLRQTFQVELPLVNLFNQPVLGKLAATVDKALAEKQTKPAPVVNSIKRLSRELRQV